MTQATNPFYLASSRAYRQWRAAKLAAYPDSVAPLQVEIADLSRPTSAEIAAIAAAGRPANLALFSTDVTTGQVPDKASLRAFGRALGLAALDINMYADDDGISALQVTQRERQRDYIPYTNQRLNWHTDGYYNRPEQRIRSFLLYCARPAATGGDNYLLDHELAYLLLRDAEPRFIEALMHPQALTIPANIEQGVEVRPAETGPVFSVEANTGNLHMRYSARTRNIQWRDDALTREAVAFLADLWENGCPYVYHHRLMPGQGLVCNNILHSRSAFQDDSTSGQTRLMYRARYYDRLAGTDVAPSRGAPDL